MPSTLYGGTAELWTQQRELGKAEVVEVDITNTDAVKEALGHHADLLW